MYSMKCGLHPDEVHFFGRRSKPVKKQFFDPAYTPYKVDHKLQAAKDSTSSVL